MTATCTECDATLTWVDGECGPAGWFDMDRHDLDSPGDVCPVSVVHEVAS